MAIFRYEGVNLAGEKLRGEMEAADSSAVADHLHRLGYVPVTAARKSTSKFTAWRHSSDWGSRKLAIRDVALFTSELATMLQAGLSLEKALTMLAAAAKKPKLATLLNALLGRVRSGVSLGAALEAERDGLPKAYVGMVRA